MGGTWASPLGSTPLFNELGGPGGHSELGGPALGRQPHHEGASWSALGGRCYTSHPLPRTTPRLHPHELPVSSSSLSRRRVAAGDPALPGRLLRKQHCLGKGVCSG